MAIEKAVGESLRERGESVAVAESCTGGLIGSLLTDIPGSSDYFDRSVVTYSYDAKLDLGVPRERSIRWGPSANRSRKRWLGRFATARA